MSTENIIEEVNTPITETVTEIPIDQNNSIVIEEAIEAILFAAGHLPATVMTMELTPVVLIRCFALNGAFGLAFGRLYRKHGIQYAMLAHAGVHIVSKLIWILFI